MNVRRYSCDIEIRVDKTGFSINKKRKFMERFLKIRVSV